MADIIASVDPQQTVISRSGSTSTPCVRSKFFSDGVSQRLCAPGNGVLIHVAIDCLFRSLFDFGGRGEIRKALREIYGAVLSGETRHFTNYGFGEKSGLR